MACGCELMRKQVCVGRVSLLSRVAVVSLVGGLAAACTSDSARFSGGNPFSNPFDSQPRHAQVAAAPQPVEQSPAYYAQAPQQVVASAPLQPVASVSGGGWTTAGGTLIRVAQGDNLNSISNRYGVPTSAILSANRLTSASQVAPGHDLVIPVYSVSGTPAQVAAPRALAPVAVAANPTTHRMPEAARTPFTPPMPPVATAAANGKQKIDAKVAIAPKAVIIPPASQKAVVGAVAAPVAASQIAKAQPVKEIPQKVASVQPTAPVQEVKVVTPAPKDAEQTASIASSSPSAEFRWPARGRVISGFGSSGGNEGINIAVPEGTPVRAAEAGTITFAGDDVKSYGNLVLIKHDNGYISAYAHNGSVDVKRGERVKRGQVIAKSGQTGNVTSPQLHFEIRKGHTPVDPVPYLGG